MRKCPKCGWEVNETDTDMWSAWDCSNPECGFGGFIDYEESL